VSRAATGAAGLLDAVGRDPRLSAALARLRAGEGVVEVAGAPEGSWPLLALAVQREVGRLLVVAADPATLADELLAVTAHSAPAPLLYPAADVLPMDRAAPSDEIVAARLRAQAAALDEKRPLLVLASPGGLMRPAPPPGEFAGGVKRLRVGDTLPPDELVAWLVDWGYTREAEVEAVGQISRRGGIVDVFSPGAHPLRVEFFGNELESIRGFDLRSQASVSRRDEATLLPAREFPFREVDRTRAFERLKALDMSRCLPEVRESWESDIGRLEAAGYFPGAEALFPYLAEAPATLLDYLGPQVTALVFEPERLARQATRQLAEVEELLRSESEHGELPAGLSPGLVPYEPTLARAAARLEVERVAVEASATLDWAPPASLATRQAETGMELRHQAAEHEHVLIVSGQPQRARHVLEGANLPATELEEMDLEATLERGILVVEGGLRSGFTVPAAGLVVYSDLELFGVQLRPRRRRASTRDAGEQLSPFHLDLEPGQLVVHRDHGIGIFRGLRRLEDGGSTREYIQVEYHGGDKVFVPVEYMDRLHVYMGGTGDDQPRLSRLGTGDWERTKSRVRKAVADMADELLRIYARRAVAEGTAFSPDGPWQAELEASFPFDETPDQLRALDEIKADMEEPSPMDRLLCGDVGFGKTELALRAAFKAAVDGKQVAVLVPTTVLAQQHFLTFSERLRPFPLRVELMSRFRTESELEQVRQGLRNGSVDIVIGTHAVLSSQVRFKDLGLVVIDEEQRFGVAQKERLKRLRASVDVLSMSATPIPRTLHMALGGIRDMSVLATPPEERLPVRTFVTADSDHLLRDVISRELERGGQVFYVHNRVRGIQAAADRVRKLLPDARVVVAHGQMPEDQLAKVMVQFIHREFDVLVCTTIIESGLDIPTANTIVVQDADRFGLADLYQLRGRVGRSRVRAYAYLLYNPERSLTEQADKRLDVIGEYQELGAGFKLALRDLEIRGAGNLLGREQSGEIVAVGLEMYNEMLRDAVAGLRGEAPAPVEEVVAVAPLELPVDHYLPRSYVPDEGVRMQVYQELAAAATDGQLETLRRRLRDRFGEPPGAVDNLLYSLRVKLAAQAARVRSIVLSGDSLELRLAPDHPLELAAFARSHSGVRASSTRLAYGWKARSGAWRDELLGILRDIAQVQRAA